MENSAILVVSFGTAYKDTRDKTIDAIEQKVQEKFPNSKIYRAFTSEKVREKLKKEGVEVHNVKEAVEKIIKDKKTDELIVQPTFISEGLQSEKLYDEITSFADRFKNIKIGTPLLTKLYDYEELADIIKEKYKLEDDEVLVLMGHGSGSDKNQTYEKFQKVLQEKKYDSIYVGTMKETPTFEDIRQKLSQKNIEKICIAPMLIVAGGHAHRDMTGSSHSWEEQLKKDGYEVRCIMRGLGELEDVQKMFIRHIYESEELCFI